MDEKLRLVIELQNKASAELRKFGKDLEGVKPGAGAKATASWFQTLEGASTSANKALRPLAGGLSTIGVSGLAAGLSVAGLVGQFRDLAKAMPALQELSRQTGISKTELERLKQTAANLNIDPSKMTAAIGAFSGEMVQFSKQSGEVYAEMQNGASGLARKIASEWKDHPEQALKDYLGWLAEIPEASKRAGKSAQEGVQIQRYWAQKGLGDADMAQVVGKGMGGFQEAYRQAAQDVGQITDEMVRQSEAFDRSITRFDASWNALKRDLGADVLPALTATTDGLRKLFDEVKGEPELAGIGAASLGALYARRRVMRAVGGGSGGIAPATAAKIEGAAVEQKTASTGFAEAVAEFKVAVAEFRDKGLPSGPGGAPAGEDPKKPGGTSFDKGRGILAALGLAGVVVNAPGMDEAGNRERDANAAALEGFGEALRKALGVEWLQGQVDAWRAGGRSASAAGFHPDDDRASRARATEVQGIGPTPTVVLSSDSYWTRKKTFLDRPQPTPPDDDRASRARPSDAPDRSLDSFVVGEVTHLRNTLHTAAKVDDGPVHQAAFHGAGFNGLSAALDPGAVISAAVKEGTLSAFRELAGLQDLDGKGAGGGGFTPAAFHPGGGIPGGRSAAAAGEVPAAGGGQGSSASGGGGRSSAAAGRARGGGADAFPGQGGTADTGGAGATSGMRARNLGNIGYFHQHDAGLIGPSNSRDVDHSIALYATQEDGIRAAARLALHKYQSGMRNTAALIAGRGGWTPGALGPGASVNVAKAMGLSNQDDLHLDDPAQMRKFLHGLAIQEHGRAGAYYTPEMIDRALSGKGATTATGPALQPAAEPPPNTGTSHAAAGHVDGVLRMGDESFRYGSGGRNGAAHIPFGDHEITPGAVGAWGASHGAMGLDGNAMWDPALKRMRTGIELHAAKSAELITSGCLGFMAEQYPRLKSRVHEMIAKTGRAYLHIDGKGASITPDAHASTQARPAIAPMPAVAPEPPPMQTEHRVSMDPLHVNLTHTEAGRTRVAVKHGEGVKVTLRTAPTMVETG